MKGGTQMKAIFLALSETLEIIDVQDSQKAVLVGGRSYSRLGDHDFHGFYDWLRRKDGSTIGVRYFVFRDYGSIIDTLKDLKYVTVGPKSDVGTELCIYFGEDRSFVSEKSADQMFSGDFFFKADDGTYGISFEVP
jgi:hypothetical protein